MNSSRVLGRRRRRLATIGVAACLVVSAGAGAAPASAESASDEPGTVVSASPLDPGLWIPGTTSDAFVLKYVTTDSFGERAHSTGTVFLPHGTAPPGGWPVISWAHGTSGLGDACAPSRVGPALPERDWAYLGEWMKQGYAVVASDYVGLGTPGLMPYLDGRTTAHNVVDMVAAGRNFASAKLPPRQQLARKWVTIGQSQGGGASIYTARFASEFGDGRGLDYRGAVGTGTPAYIENLLMPLGPELPPVALSPGITAYVSYILAGLRFAHPELNLDSALTPEGEKFVEMAETECVTPFEEKLGGVSLGDYFSKPLITLPKFRETVRDYMGMPESGFDEPLFMAHGLADQDVPIIGTAAYAALLHGKREPVTFKTYPADHSGTMSASLPDTRPFVRERFAKPSTP